MRPHRYNLRPAVQRTHSLPWSIPSAPQPGALPQTWAKACFLSSTRVLRVDPSPCQETSVDLADPLEKGCWPGQKLNESVRPGELPGNMEGHPNHVKCRSALKGVFQPHRQEGTCACGEQGDKTKASIGRWAGVSPACLQALALRNEKRQRRGHRPTLPWIGLWFSWSWI